MAHRTDGCRTASTPPQIIAMLNRAIGDYLQGAEVQQKLLSFGLATEGAGTPTTTASFIRSEQDAWRALATELDIQPQ